MKNKKKKIINEITPKTSMVIDFSYVFCFLLIFSILFLSISVSTIIAMQGKIRHVSNFRNESVARCTAACNRRMGWRWGTWLWIIALWRPSCWCYNIRSRSEQKWYARPFSRWSWFRLGLLWKPSACTLLR